MADKEKQEKEYFEEIVENTSPIYLEQIGEEDSDSLEVDSIFSEKEDELVKKDIFTKIKDKFFDFLDGIWTFFTKEEIEKRRIKRENKPVTIVVYKPKSQFRKFLTLMTWLVFLFLLAFVFYKGYTFTNDLVKEINKFDAKTAIGEISEENQKILDIPSGATTKDISNILFEEGIISNETYFWVYSLLMGNEGNYKSGKHMIDSSVTYDSGDFDIITAQGYEMLIYILAQDSIPNPTERIFFTEGLTFEQTVNLFIEKGIGSKKGFYDTGDKFDFDYDFLDQIPEDRRRTNRLEGYLFPDTYIFDVTVDESENIEKMLHNFDNKFNETYREKAELMGYTIDEIVIIASLLEKEAATMSERAMIAGVIYNRLNSTDSSMNYLQIDATIQYLYINETGHVKEFLTYDDQRILNSYNTYVYSGLPPGPICNPSLSSIAAALYPESHNYYYYVAKNDGTDAHAYARTLAEHNYNVSIYMK